MDAGFPQSKTRSFLRIVLRTCAGRVGSFWLRGAGVGGRCAVVARGREMGRGWGRGLGRDARCTGVRGRRAGRAMGSAGGVPATGAGGAAEDGASGGSRPARQAVNISSSAVARRRSSSQSRIIAGKRTQLRHVGAQVPFRAVRRGVNMFMFCFYPIVTTIASEKNYERKIFSLPAP